MQDYKIENLKYIFFYASWIAPSNKAANKMSSKYIWPYPILRLKICCLFYIKIEVCFSYLNIYSLLRQNKLKLTRFVSLFFKATTSIKYYDHKNLSKYCITCFSFLRSIIPFAKYFFLICVAQGCANIFLLPSQK